MAKFDLLVIGCGSAGFSAASRALDYGKNVCIVEYSQIGGAGIMKDALVSENLIKNGVNIHHEAKKSCLLLK